MSELRIMDTTSLLPGLRKMALILVVLNGASLPALAQTSSPPFSLPQQLPKTNSDAFVGMPPSVGVENQTETGGNILPFPALGAKDDARARPKPPPGAAVSLQNKKAEEDMRRLDEQVNSRLSEMTIGNPPNMERGTGGADTSTNSAGLRPGSGNLSAPNLAPYKSELDEMSEEERQIRLLQLKQEHADLAMKLWSTLYDPREFIDGRPVPPPAPAKDKAGADEDKNKKKAENEPPPAKAAPQPENPENFGSAALPYPKILEISGAGGKLQATLLVPYLGEMIVTKGAVLPGGRQVSRIDEQGVLVNDPKAGDVPLGYGDSVPLSPPSMPTQMANGMTNGHNMAPMGQIPPMMAPPPPPAVPNFANQFIK